MTAFQNCCTALFRIGRVLRDYLGAGAIRRRHRIVDIESLRRYIESRANHVTQISLYGYLRTRAGTRFQQLFGDNEFVRLLNIARWQVWLACVSDLAVYAGGLVLRRTSVGPQAVGRLIGEAVDSILAEIGLPAEAGPEYPAAAEQVRSRLRSVEWASVQDDDTPFSLSPGALVHWAPIMDELKKLDEEIVANSMRFRWQETRRELRTLLDAEALVGAPRADAGPRSPGGRT